MKKDEGRPAGAPRTPRLTLEGDGTSDPGRYEPRLVVEVPFEGSPRIIIDALEFGDELRLRAWVRSSQHRLGRLIADAIAGVP